MQLIDAGNVPTSLVETPPAIDAAVPQSVPVVAPTSQENTKLATSVQPIQVGDIEIPVTKVRRAIANNMVRSVHEVPHAWMMMEVDVTDLVAYRDNIKTEFKQKKALILRILLSL